MTVYTPREDSYLLRDFILRQELEGKKALDMGTGSGIIALAMAEKGAEVTAADVNPEALKKVGEKAEKEQVDLRTVESDLFDRIKEDFDIITFNPPYLPGEEGVGDEEIWRGGEKGVEVAERFLEQVDKHLSKDGSAYIILSSRSEYEPLVERFDLEILDSEKLWFEQLFLARYE